MTKRSTSLAVECLETRDVPTALSAVVTQFGTDLLRTTLDVGAVLTQQQTLLSASICNDLSAMWQDAGAGRFGNLPGDYTRLAQDLLIEQVLAQTFGAPNQSLLNNAAVKQDISALIPDVLAVSLAQSKSPAPAPSTPVNPFGPIDQLVARSGASGGLPYQLWTNYVGNYLGQMGPNYFSSGQLPTIAQLAASIHTNPAYGLGKP